MFDRLGCSGPSPSTMTRSVAGLALLFVLAACDSGPRAPRAGSQPLPSSEAPRFRPAADGRSRPMFSGPAAGDRTKALAGTRMMRDERAREEREAAARGPVRIGGEQERGQRLSARMGEAAAAADPADPCEQGWAAQQAMREELGARGQAQSQQDYLRACRELPEDQRNCMSPAYLRDHAEECERVQTESMERLQRQGHVARTRADLAH
jgi:hypothetical protein